MRTDVRPFSGVRYGPQRRGARVVLAARVELVRLELLSRLDPVVEVQVRAPVHVDEEHVVLP